MTATVVATHPNMIPAVVRVTSWLPACNLITGELCHHQKSRSVRMECFLFRFFLTYAPQRDISLTTSPQAALEAMRSSDAVHKSPHNKVLKARPYEFCYTI